MIGPASYLNIVRASAWYDLVVTIGFATPWTFTLFHGGLNTLIRLLGLPGSLPPFAPEHMLMANLLGSIVTIWAILRLRNTQQRYGRYDAAGRLLFAAWQSYALVLGAHPILIGFVIAELGFGIAQLVPVRHNSAGCPDRELQLAKP
jgi:hypothetical protein